MASLQQKSSIVNIAINKSQDHVRTNKTLTVNLSFRIEGQIREVFQQRTWERAYNKHDNIFRLTTKVHLRSKRKMVTTIKLVRKAILFWTRNPRIHHRIWIMIVKDDNSFYPSTVDEARALLFDFDKVIELNGNDLDKGKHYILADISVSWGKHLFCEPTKIDARSNEIQISRDDT